MDHSLEHHKDYIGLTIDHLPTPSLVISLPTLKKNIETLHQDVERLGIDFRPHVKTLKSLEVTRMMLSGGKYRGIVASTLAEVRGALPLVEEGVLDECLYGIPIYPGALPHLTQLRKSIRILLMVDNEQQIGLLEDSQTAIPWDVFIKIDVGTHRAGVPLDSTSLHNLVSRAHSSPALRIHGFYCHAGHSYSGRSKEDAERTLRAELAGVLGAAALLPENQQKEKLVLSVGSTPTAHVVQSLGNDMPANIRLELHAGNFPCNDLQQVSTGLVSETDQALRIMVEVCSVYPNRNEALVNAGAIAISRETSSSYPGFGRPVDHPGWGVVRISQEHGIIGRVGDEKKKKQEEGEENVTALDGTTAEVAEQVFKVGQRLALFCNHACITASAYHVYYVADEQDIVREAWMPWKGW